MADIYRIGVSLALSNGVSQVLGVMARDMMGFRGEVGKTQEQMNRLKGVMMGVGAVMGGAAILGGMVKLVEHGRELVHQQALMAEQGMTVREQAEATAAAYQTASDVMGTNVSKNTALVRELRGVLGNTTDALKVMPEFAKAGLLINSMKGSHNERDLQTLAKALELRGDLINPKTGKIDSQTLHIGLDQAFRTMSASGGLISANDLMGVTKQAGPMARMMNSKQFYDTIFSAIMEMGGQRAGTALSAVGRAMYGGIMPKRNAAEFGRLGLLEMGHIQEGKGGSMIINSEAFKGIKTLTNEGLLAYTEKVLKPALERHGMVTSQQMQMEMYRLFPTETSRRLIGLFLQQAETVRRDIKLREGAQGVDQAYKTGLENDPTVKMRAFKEAWDNLMTSLGAPLVGPATDALVLVAKKVNEATLFFSQHADGVRVIGEMTAAFGGLLVVGGSLTIASVALGPFAAGLRALSGPLGMFVKGGVGEVALSTMSGTTGFATVAGGLSAVASGIGLLAAAVIVLPPLLKAVTDLLPSGTPNSGRAAPTHGGGAYPGPHAPEQSWGDWWRSLTAGGGHSGANMRSGVHKEAYVTGGNGAPVVPIIIQVDGRILSRVNAQYTAGAWRAQHGQTQGDMRAMPVPAGATTSA